MLGWVPYEGPASVHVPAGECFPWPRPFAFVQALCAPSVSWSETSSAGNARSAYA